MRIQPLRLGLAAATAAALVGGAGAIGGAGAASAAAAGCQVTYSLGSEWSGGFTGNVAVTNLGDPLDGWALTWSFPAGQRVSQAWNATVTQSGGQVRAANAAWNGRLPTNGAASFGFNATWTGSNPAPTDFALNGVACTGATTPPTAGPTAGPTTAAPTAGPTVPATRPPTTAPGQPPPARTVRVYWLKPSDVAYDQRYPDGIANVMREAQRYYRQELGVTFTLNSPVVEVVNGERPRSWYENTPACGEKYWWTVCNMQAELIRRLGLRAPDERWINVGLISAEGDGAGGGGGNGWVILSGHDADGNAGINGPMNRWYGGMVHELGHALGLPDSSYTDGTPMSASFYNYPDTHFSQAQKDGIRNGRYGSFLS